MFGSIKDFEPVAQDIIKVSFISTYSGNRYPTKCS